MTSAILKGIRDYLQTELKNYKNKNFSKYVVEINQHSKFTLSDSLNNDVAVFKEPKVLIYTDTIDFEKYNDSINVQPYEYKTIINIIISVGIKTVTSPSNVNEGLEVIDFLDFIREKLTSYKLTIDFNTKEVIFHNISKPIHKQAYFIQPIAISATDLNAGSVQWKQIYLRLEYDTPMNVYEAE